MTGSRFFGLHLQNGIAAGDSCGPHETDTPVRDWFIGLVGEGSFDVDEDIPILLEIEESGRISWEVLSREDVQGYRRVKCDQCAALVINGIACHESGCPNQKKPWIVDGKYLVPGNSPEEECYE